MRTFNRNRIYKHPLSRHSVLNNSGSRLLPLPAANQRRILHHHRERWIPTLLQLACIPLASLSQTPGSQNLRSQSIRRMFQRGVWRCVAVMQLVEASVRVSKNILLLNDIETTTRPCHAFFFLGEQRGSPTTQSVPEHALLHYMPCFMMEVIILARRSATLILFASIFFLYLCLHGGPACYGCANGSNLLSWQYFLLLSIIGLGVMASAEMLPAMIELDSLVSLCISYWRLFSVFGELLPHEHILSYSPIGD